MRKTKKESPNEPYAVACARHRRVRDCRKCIRYEKHECRQGIMYWREREAIERAKSMLTPEEIALLKEVL